MILYWFGLQQRKSKPVCWTSRRKHLQCEIHI